MQPASQPNVANLSDQLAADNARVDAFVKSLPGWVDRMVDVAAQKDWPNVRRLSEYLALSGESCGCTNLHARARQLADECQKPENELGIRRGVIRVIGACGTASPGKAAESAE